MNNTDGVLMEKHWKTKGKRMEVLSKHTKTKNIESVEILQKRMEKKRRLKFLGLIDLELFYCKKKQK